MVVIPKGDRLRRNTSMASTRTSECKEQPDRKGHDAEKFSSCEIMARLK